jgi:hypothetical protein
MLGTDRRDSGTCPQLDDLLGPNGKSEGIFDGDNAYLAYGLG